MPIRYVCAALLLLGFAAFSLAEEPKWGHLSGKIVLTGEPPRPEPIVISSDKDAFGDAKLVDESLLVNSENKGIVNVVVYLLPGKEKIKTHPAYAMHAEDKIDFNHIGGRMEPHVVLLRTSQTLVVGNKDSVGHNAKFEMFANEIP